MMKKSGSYLYLMTGGLWLLLVAFTMPVFAQQQSTETRKERKEREKNEKLKQYEAAKKLILDSLYAVPFERAVSRHGEMATGIRSKSNFLIVEGDMATLQFRSGHAPWPGLNGLGGYTIKGKIINLKITEKESKNKLFLTFTISGNIRNKISLSLYGSGEAAVDIDHPQYGRAETLFGPVEPVGQSTVIEGQTF
jgi:hypothetical protein